MMIMMWRRRTNRTVTQLYLHILSSVYKPACTAEKKGNMLHALNKLVHKLDLFTRGGKRENS
jgi:hypothetical protein